MAGLGSVKGPSARTRGNGVKLIEWVMRIGTGQRRCIRLSPDSWFGCLWPAERDPVIAQTAGRGDAGLEN
jgi:hypothetical protein